MTDANPRAALRDAIADRAFAHAAKDAAAQALERAGGIAAEAKAELGRHEGANASAEAARADEIVVAIRRGAKVAITLNAAIREAQQKMVEAGSRHRMAEAARDQLAAELAEAQAAAKAADEGADGAALAVVVSEVEAEVAPLDELLARLATIDDAVFAAARLWQNGRALQLSPAMTRAVLQLRPLRDMIASTRSQRAILSGTHEDEMVGRLRAYRAALQSDPDIKIDAVAAPKVERAILPPVNEIEASRLRAALDVAAA